MAHQIRSKLSPWYNERPTGVGADSIMLHTTEGSDAGDLSYMTDPKHDAKVSYHFLVLRTGEIWQLVPTSHRAWHAGKSTWAGRSDLNDFTIGVGFSNKLNEHLTPEQYEAGGWLIAKLVREEKIPFDRIISHENASFPRKNDPWWTFQFFRLAGWAVAYLAPELAGVVVNG